MSVTNMTRGAWCAMVAGAVVAIGGCKKGKASGAAGFGGGAPLGGRERTPLKFRPRLISVSVLFLEKKKIRMREAYNKTSSRDRATVLALCPPRKRHSTTALT